MQKQITAVVFAVAIVVASIILGYAVINRNNKSGNIAVTGLGQTNFTSDLIVWEAQFSKINTDLKQAYSDLKEDKETISDYLISKGLPDSVLVFSAVTSSKKTKNKYSNDGKYIGVEFIGYSLNQSVQIKATDVERVEKISREITELLNKGIQLYSSPPRYYYTKLEDLKIEMVSRATENARLRAQSIAQNSGATLSELTSAHMGVFQILGQYSNEDYSWGGTHNTSSKEKTASITMKLNYNVE